MSYELGFHPDALEERRKLDTSVREVFKKKLVERLLNPRVSAARLSGQKDRFKIKLRNAYRLVYEVRDPQLIVVVVAVGRRERNAVYTHRVQDIGVGTGSELDCPPPRPLCIVRSQGLQVFGDMGNS